MAVLIYPGHVTRALALQDVLREAHEAVREQMRTAAAERKAKGLPLTDDVDWRAEIDRVEALAKAANREDVIAYRERLQAALAATSAVIADPGEYQPSDDLDGITVQFRVLSHERHQELIGELVASGDDALMQRSARWGYVQASVATIYADGAWLDVDDATASAIDRSGWGVALYLAARYMQGLPAKKLQAFGLRPPSTSKAFVATSARGKRENEEGATAEATSSGSATLKQTPAQDDTSLERDGSPMSSPSIDLLTEASTESTAMHG